MNDLINGWVILGLLTIGIIYAMGYMFMINKCFVSEIDILVTPTTFIFYIVCLFSFSKLIDLRDWSLTSLSRRHSLLS